MGKYKSTDRRTMSIKERVLDMIPIGSVIGILLLILNTVSGIKEIVYNQRAVNDVQDESIFNLKDRVATNAGDIKELQGNFGSHALDDAAYRGNNVP